MVRRTNSLFLGKMILPAQSAIKSLQTLDALCRAKSCCRRRVCWRIAIFVSDPNSGKGGGATHELAYGERGEGSSALPPFFKRKQYAKRFTLSSRYS